MAKDLFSSNPPFTPPTTEEDRLAWLRLIRSARVGPATFYRLMQEHGSAQFALDALPEIARAAGVDQYQIYGRDAALREIDAARQVGAKMACFGTPHYPATLATLNDAPPVLWCMGRRDPVLQPMVAIVGARNASSLGTRMARKLSEGLGYSGYTVVSGLARGIDTAAHHAALKTGTIAVMAGGVDVIYPPENAVLAAAIADQGLRISEQPIGLQPQARHFPRRNRLISGLALGVVVVEAAEKSGSLITARDALDQGREVMAVPGHPVDARAGGCNVLIRDGATLVRSAEDVLEVLGPYRMRAPQSQTGPDTLAMARHRKTPPQFCEMPTPPDALRGPAHAQPPDHSALHATILARLGPSPIAEDQLIRDLAQPPAAVLTQLMTLELTGAVVRHSGGMISRAQPSTR